MAQGEYRRHRAAAAFLSGPLVEPVRVAVYFAAWWVLDAARRSPDGRFFPVGALAADLAAKGVVLREFPMIAVRSALAQHVRDRLAVELGELLAPELSTSSPDAGLPIVLEWLLERQRSLAGPPVSFAGLADDLRAAFPFGLDPLPLESVWELISDILDEEIESCRVAAS